MGGSTRSSTSTVNNAYDNRSFVTIDDRDFTRIETNDNREYDIDNSVRSETTISNEYDVDSSISDSYNTSVLNEYDINSSNSNNVTTTNEYDQRVDNSDNSIIEDAYNTTLGDGATYAAAGANITINNTETDGGVIAAALEFAQAASADANDLTESALTEAFKSTVGGLQDQTNKWMTAVSGIAIAAVAVTAFARR